MSFEFFTDRFEDFIGVDFWTMIFAWINLAILYFVLKKVLFKPIKNMIDTRQKEIDDMYSDAERSKSDASALKSEYEEKIDRAEEESEQILRAAQRKAQLREEEILRDAEEKARRTQKRAEEQIELERKRAINDIKDEVSGMAIDIAAAVIERDIDKKQHEALIDDFISTMGDGK